MARVEELMRKQRGFTLIELMIVVAIVAILAGIALPTYERYVDRSYRAQAQATMYEMAQRLERRYSQTYTYGAEKDDAKPSEVEPALSPDTIPTDGTPRYQLKVSITGEGNAYSITVIPQGAQADDECGQMGLSQDGSVTAQAQDCWG